MAHRLRTLFTNNTLSHPAGTELSLLDASLSLKSRGCDVAAFSTDLGEIADRLRAAGITVVQNLTELPWEPQVIHGQHEWETTLAALCWPHVPVISFCRGPYLWQEAPCRAPNVVLYAAVDEECRRRLVEKDGIAPDKVELVLNGVDLKRFRQRASLPPNPRRALVLSNYASDENFLPVVRSACESLNISFHVIGKQAGNPTKNPEEALGDFDIVFAKGKSALESLATGCALVVADTTGLGPIVTSENFEALRRLSFGNPAMTDVFSVENVQNRLKSYDANEAAAVSAHVRETCGLENTIDKLEQIYERATTTPVVATSADWSRFTAHFLTNHASAYKLGRRVQEAWHEAWGVPDPAELDPATADRILTHFVQNEAKRANLQARCDRLRAELDELKSKESAQKPKRGILNQLFKPRSSPDGE